MKSTNMSRIGKKPILLPNGVNAAIEAGAVMVTGPKGSVRTALPTRVHVAEQADPRALVVTVDNTESPEEKALWGLVRQLLSNAVTGVQKPFEKALEFVGVGFKVAMSGRNVQMEVGFSHPVTFPLPEGIEAKVEKQIVTLSGVDKHQVGEVAAQIRRIRPPEPYKGKGIRYTTETVRRKAGKAASGKSG